MTNLGYLRASLTPLGFGEDYLRSLLELGGLEAEETLQREACDLLLYEHIGTLCLGAVRNISEGDLSISYNVEALRLFYRTLCHKTGRPNLVEQEPRRRLRYRSF